VAVRATAGSDRIRRRAGDESKPDAVAIRVSKLLMRRAPSAQSLLVTLFGDCIAVHGGRVWLGSLIDALAMFGIGERLTRTSVFRLVKDDWLAVERSGRRAYYAFTTHGRREYERTAQRIYATGRAAWDGSWTLAIPHAVSGPARERLRASLGWIGFGQLSGGVFAHPSADRAALADVIDELQLGARVLIVDARIGDVVSLAALARERWNVTQLATRYRRFLADFEPFATLPLQRTDSRTRFVVRTLLIHEYRRILLTDPDLPDALLPTDWPGRVAGRLTKALYRRLARSTSEFITAHFVDAGGPVPAPDAAFARRFA
jgi:phenylacetic acid degradation operon negative regulatory protein